MNYPPPPWINKGRAVQVLRLVDVGRARSFVPAPLKVVQVLPGKTVGIVIFADYQPGSALTYHELTIAPALVRAGRNFGWWISHIYVDDPDFMAGGREVWGLPKQLARFSWNLPAGQVEAYQDDQLLCALLSQAPSRGVRLPLFLPSISRLGSRLLAFRVGQVSTVGLSPAALEVPATSPFAPLNLSGWTRAFHSKDMIFTANAPWTIGRSHEE